MADFFAMGGYAGFIWPAYGITAVVLVAIVILSYRSLKKNQIDLAHLQAMEPDAAASSGSERSSQQAVSGGEPRETQA